MAAKNLGAFKGKFNATWLYFICYLDLRLLHSNPAMFIRGYRSTKAGFFYMCDISFPVIKGPGESERVISITIEGEQGKSAGLSGSATVK